MELSGLAKTSDGRKEHLSLPDGVREGLLTKLQSVTIEATDGSARFALAYHVFGYIDKGFGFYHQSICGTPEIQGSIYQINKNVLMSEVVSDLGRAEHSLVMSEAQCINFAQNNANTRFGTNLFEHDSTPMVMLIENAGKILIVKMERYPDGRLFAHRYGSISGCKTIWKAGCRFLIPDV